MSNRGVEFKLPEDEVQQLYEEGEGDTRDDIVYQNIESRIPRSKYVKSEFQFSLAKSLIRLTPVF